MPVAPERLREVAGRAQPMVLAGERLLPVLPALVGLLPDGGLRRGTVVGVGSARAARPTGAARATGAVGAASGTTSLALALLAGPSAAGSWCAAVGLPSLGLVAASEAGIALERFPLVASPPPQEWATVVAALLDSLDVVLAWSPPHLRPGEARRLASRARERSAVLVVGGRWPEETELRLGVASSEWVGLGRGHGRLTGRRAEVVTTGRRAATRERRAWLWLPGPEGISLASEPAQAPARRALATLASEPAQAPAAAAACPTRASNNPC